MVVGDVYIVNNQQVTGGQGATGSLTRHVRPAKNPSGLLTFWYQLKVGPERPLALQNYLIRAVEAPGGGGEGSGVYPSCSTSPRRRALRRHPLAGPFVVIRASASLASPSVLQNAAFRSSQRNLTVQTCVFLRAFRTLPRPSWSCVSTWVGVNVATTPAPSRPTASPCVPFVFNVAFTNASRAFCTFHCRSKHGGKLKPPPKRTALVSAIHSPRSGGLLGLLWWHRLPLQKHLAWFRGCGGLLLPPPSHRSRPLDLPTFQPDGAWRPTTHSVHEVT